MASGRTHEIINLVALPPIVYYFSPYDFSFFVGGYLVGTFLLTPDIDIYHSKPVQRWKFFKFIWKPYTKFSKHRGISHIPFYGSTIKIAYLFAIFLFLYFIIYWTANYFNIKLPFVIKGENEIKALLLNIHTISFFFGLVIAEFVHIVVDIIYSSLKKLRIIR
ncbi:metal-binding protein [Hydrogenothermus marinus]|uniref:Putative metal-binding protein n=1 Tax=Hydrogenothermus marinus TaxID=133270 RepID=A0A3M0BIQ4_9AQUI|nr:metal-binding protein [Hydrogenothermus marinus]RMA97313.1 putative metal-binding protein [Hydrogenothermus marinus]